MAEKKSKLVDLKRTKAEKKERQEAIKAMPAGEDYSYGTRMHLGEDELEKLGHEENPEVGSEHEFHVRGRVTHSSHDQDEGAEPRRSVTVQVTHMSPLEAKEAEKKPARSVRDEIKDSVREHEEKSEKTAAAKAKKSDEEKGE